MDRPAVRAMSADDRDAAVETLILAFAEDPFARWFSPAAVLLPQQHGGLARVVSRQALEHESAFCTDDVRGVALWLLPGVKLDEEALETAVPGPLTSAAVADLRAPFASPAHRS